MRRGHEGRGRQIGAFLAGASRSMKHPGHHTRTATYDRTTTTTPGRAKAATCVTAGCNMACQSADTTTARQLTQPYTNYAATGTQPLVTHTQSNYEHQ